MSNYLRDWKGDRGTCPWCLREQRLTKGGRLVRHGWRTVPAWGAYVVHSDHCSGVGLRPLEVTDEDGLRACAELDSGLEEMRADLASTLAQGGDAYAWDLDQNIRGGPGAIDAVTASLRSALGERVHITTGERTDPRSCRMERFIKADALILRGEAGRDAGDRLNALRVPSWDELRRAKATRIGQAIAGAVASRDAIVAAIEQFRAVPQ